MSYQHTDPEHYAPPDPPLPTLEERIIEELEEVGVEVEWMGLELFISAADWEDGAFSFKLPSGCFFPLSILWPKPSASQVERLIAIAYPRDGKVLCPETAALILHNIRIGEECTGLGISNCLGDADAQEILGLAWVAAWDRVRKAREERPYREGE